VAGTSAESNNTISIVSGSASKTTTADAFQPNPAQVSVGDNNVTWTNDDAFQQHTVTHQVKPHRLQMAGLTLV
jgi:plastocyanin